MLKAAWNHGGQTSRPRRGLTHVASRHSRSLSSWFFTLFLLAVSAGYSARDMDGLPKPDCIRPKKEDNLIRSSRLIEEARCVCATKKRHTTAPSIWEDGFPWSCYATPGPSASCCAIISQISMRTERRRWHCKQTRSLRHESNQPFAGLTVVCAATSRARKHKDFAWVPPGTGLDGKRIISSRKRDRATARTLNLFRRPRHTDLYNSANIKFA